MKAIRNKHNQIREENQERGGSQIRAGSNQINKDFYNGIINELQFYVSLQQKEIWRDLPGGVVVKNPPVNTGDMGSSPGP